MGVWSLFLFLVALSLRMAIGYVNLDTAAQSCLTFLDIWHLDTGDKNLKRHMQMYFDVPQIQIIEKAIKFGTSPDDALKLLEEVFQKSRNELPQRGEATEKDTDASDEVYHRKVFNKHLKICANLVKAGSRSGKMENGECLVQLQEAFQTDFLEQRHILLMYKYDKLDTSNLDQVDPNWRHVSVACDFG
eukprot:Platyproteum_vivax@DN11345_c0_g1_i1.p1